MEKRISGILLRKSILGHRQNRKWHKEAENGGRRWTIQVNSVIDPSWWSGWGTRKTVQKEDDDGVGLESSGSKAGLRGVDRK